MKLLNKVTRLNKLCEKVAADMTSRKCNGISERIGSMFWVSGRSLLRYNFAQWLCAAGDLSLTLWFSVNKELSKAFS
jgi:hypothetical protein